MLASYLCIGTANYTFIWEQDDQERKIMSKPKSSLTGAATLTVQLPSEMGNRVRTEAKTANSNISRFLRQLIMDHYRELDSREAAS